MPKRRPIVAPRGAQTQCAHPRQRVLERLDGERVQICRDCSRTLAVLQRAWRHVSDAALAEEARRRQLRRDEGLPLSPT